MRTIASLNKDFPPFNWLSRLEYRVLFCLEIRRKVYVILSLEATKHLCVLYHLRQPTGCKFGGHDKRRISCVVSYL